MAHFAELDKNNNVKRVIVVSNEDILDSDGEEKESIGISFLHKLFGEETIWKQTSYNNNFRKKYAAIGDTYREDLDAFISQKPYDSWVLNKKSCLWEAPIPKPHLTEEQINHNEDYLWDENIGEWIKIFGRS